MSTPEQPVLSGPKASGILRPVALGTTVAGAMGSVAFTFMVGRHNDSRVLMGLFIGWVLGPFIGLYWADRFARRWSATVRVALLWVMLIVALGSLTSYGMVALGPPRPRPAAMFLLVPAVSWLVAVMIISLVGLFSRQHRT